MPASALEFRLNDTVSSVGATVELDGGVVSPRDIQKTVWMPDQLGGELLRALRGLSGDADSVGEFQTILAEEHGVTALDGAYAATAARAVQNESDAVRLLNYTRHFGGTISSSLRTSLDDVADGPIPVFEAVGERPTLVVELSQEWWDATKSTQRNRLFAHLHRLSPGVDVQIAGSKLQLRRVLQHHADEFSASVIEDAQSSLFGPTPSSPLTRTAQVRAEAQAVREQRGDDHVDWPRLATLLEPPRQTRTYDELENDVRLDMERKSIRQFALRCREDGLVTTQTINQERHLRLTRVGLAALDLVSDSDLQDNQDASLSSLDSWNTENTNQDGVDQNEGESNGVRDPRNLDESTVLSHTHENAPPDRPAGEGSVAVSGGADDRDTSPPSVPFSSLHAHHAAGAAAPSSGFALSSRDLDDRGDDRIGSWSFNEERNEVVVRARSSTLQALTMTRICGALVSDKAVKDILTAENLDGGPAKTALRGLKVSNDYVLREGACLGWLSAKDATGQLYRNRLIEASNELIADAGGLDVSDVDKELASSVLKKALGLFGTVVRVYDLLGIDVVVDLEVPSYISTHEDGRKGLVETIAKATACGSRYGVYSANRVLYEPRPEKRAQTLGTPSVDNKPVGTLNPRWVLSGPDVEPLQEELSDIEDHLDLQEDGENFAKFLLRADVVDGNRREAVAEAASRIMSFGDLEETRAAISLLRVFFSNTFDVTRALSTLNTDEDNPRPIDLVDLRSALAMFADRYDPKRLLEDLGGPVVSKTIGALLDAEEQVSTAALAELADVSTRSLNGESNQVIFDTLEEIGLLQRENQGPGKATLWRLCLPFDAERFDSTAPIPEGLPDEPDSSESSTHISRATSVSYTLFEILVNLHDEYGHDLGIDWGGPLVLKVFDGPQLSGEDLDQFLDRHHDLKPIVSLVISLLDSTLPVTTVNTASVEFGKDPALSSKQASLQSVTG